MSNKPDDLFCYKDEEEKKELHDSIRENRISCECALGKCFLAILSLALVGIAFFYYFGT